MASRAHVFPDYSYGREVNRRRRAVVFQTNDPVVLPRGRSWDLNGGLLAAAAAATLLVAGATYALYYTEPARLAETPTESISREYVPPADFARINALKALSAPAIVTPETMSSASPAEATTAPMSSFDSTSPLVPSTSREVTIDDSAPGVQDSLPQPAENQPSTAPYPNPTTTPPDAIAPTEEPGTPGLDGENPYR